MKKHYQVFLSILLMGFFWLQPAESVLKIDILQGREAALPIAIVPFANNANQTTDIAAVITSDLARSGQFKPLPAIDMVEKPSQSSDINFSTWRFLKVDFLLIGRILQNASGGSEVEFELHSVHSKQRLLGQRFTITPGELRSISHRISDIVYEKLLGIPGIFLTKISYVTAKRQSNNTFYELVVADADGYNPQTVVKSREPLLSPSWSPDGQKLAYVSFENKKSAIFVQNVNTGQRQMLTNYSGINGAPSWSPDGRKLALTLSKTGNPEIFIIDVLTKQLTQVTQHWSIDTEPVWMKDGKQLLFTSDRSGKPNVYRVDLNTKQIARLTFAGNSNARATVSPDGKYIAYVNEEQNRYRIALLDIKTNVEKILSEGNLDESPSFAPNGSMILFASREGRKGVLRAVSTDGWNIQKLGLTDGDIREPSWAPFR